jgi:hypothetical protein
MLTTIICTIIILVFGFLGLQKLEDGLRDHLRYMEDEIKKPIKGKNI